MERSKYVWLIVLLGVLSASLMLWPDPHPDSSSYDSGAAADVQETSADEEAEEEASSLATQQPALTGQAQQPALNRLENREERRAAWEAIRAAIEEARTARVPTPTSSATSTHEPPQPEYGSLDAEYIRDAMSEVGPLLMECYELAREEEPSLAGRLVLEFSIGGEPDVGGVVEEVIIAEDSEIQHEVLNECVRETVYTIELPAPEAGGRVDVTYPVTFAHNDAHDEEEAPKNEP